MYRQVSHPIIELRLAQANDSDVVRRLAALDSAPELAGQVLIALIDGDAVAGLSLLDHRVVANPFVPTRDAIALLRLRAEHLSGARTQLTNWPWKPNGMWWGTSARASS